MTVLNTKQFKLQAVRDSAGKHLGIYDMKHPETGEHLGSVDYDSYRKTWSARVDKRSYGGFKTRREATDEVMIQRS